MSQSYSFLGLASNAIDGNRDGIYIHGSCAHTANHLNPWWRVDLLKSYKVKLIVLTSREDCCPEQINGAEILIGDSLANNGNSNPRCAVVQNLGSGMTTVYHCNGMVGRYVNVVKPDKTESVVFSELEYLQHRSPKVQALQSNNAFLAASSPLSSSVLLPPDFRLDCWEAVPFIPHPEVFQVPDQLAPPGGADKLSSVVAGCPQHPLAATPSPNRAAVLDSMSHGATEKIEEGSTAREAAPKPPEEGTAMSMMAPPGRMQQRRPGRAWDPAVRHTVWPGSESWSGGKGSTSEETENSLSL
ncbi:FUCL4 protein, partial [Polypterus senegalus]